MSKQARHLTVQFDKGSSRTETLLGREYFVVPCVAMVEGVRFGANQDNPELGLASEFGDNPIMWANRPLVLNHPKINGVFVSANTPEVLELYEFGRTMNPELDGDKLKMEAWIDVARVEELGGEFQDTLDRIKAEEDVEVSVGFFSDVTQQKGVFKGQQYKGIWVNIKPDHLAILSEGLTGACSVEAGCGVPRLNQEGNAMSKTPTPIKTDSASNTAPPITQCSCGGAHAQEDHKDPEADKPVTQGAISKIIQDVVAQAIKPFTQTAEEKALQAHIDSGARARNELLVTQSIDPSLMSNDVSKMISRALSKKFPNEYSYLLGYTQDKAIFERYCSTGYATYQIGVNVSASDVEFVGDVQEVLLQTKIVPQSAAAPTDIPSPTAQETEMSGDNTKKDGDAAVTTQAAPKVQTAAEYVAAAPSEIKEMLEAGLRANAEKRTALTEAIKAHKGQKFTDDDLKAMSMDMLEKTLSLLPGNYAGVATPNAPAVQTADSETVPVPKIQWGGTQSKAA